MRKVDSSSLALLSAAALALPAFGATQPTERTLAVSTSVYQEDDLERSRLAFGDVERFKVKTNQFYVSAPMGRDWSGSVRYDNEAMSGASPWGTSVSADGQTDVIMSGASIDDSRNGLDVSLTRYFDQSSFSVSLGYSGEDDYHSRSVGMTFERDFLIAIQRWPYRVVTRPMKLPLRMRRCMDGYLIKKNAVDRFMPA